MIDAFQPESPKARWQQWLEECGEVFLFYARQQTRCESDAQDVFQEALVETWTRNDGAVPEKAVVFTSIRRRAIDLGRSLDRRTRREDFTARSAPLWFVPDYSAGDTREFLARAIADLPPDLREVLVLRIWGDLSFPDIAQLVGVPTPTATSRYRYALERLRPTLAELHP